MNSKSTLSKTIFFDFVAEIDQDFVFEIDVWEIL